MEFGTCRSYLVIVLLASRLSARSFSLVLPRLVPTLQHASDDNDDDDDDDPECRIPSAAEVEIVQKTLGVGDAQQSNRRSA